ncbi:hypothetical protein [Oscillospiraceae bacterium]|nr:hypothetical protein [Oscillospiraceae bacterium]
METFFVQNYKTHFCSFRHNQSSPAAVPLFPAKPAKKRGGFAVCR